ncbi:uncharacterized protein LOC132551171 [Ylistrum balloti]|uniref:uncharacterized protein LOC132551171 n=1 Tax=Ylistrum balloti TaxID=509963 RepID=UPI002905AFBC|nr:uncharacterized protein LOC132551171 [Ylistrum balloti]
MTILGCLGFAALSAIVTMLLCCLHMIGCYSGPVMSFGARHVYPKGPLCTCRDYCCCCCRCCKFCKMCCVGDEGDGEENIDEETKLSMIKNEDDNQYPEKSPEVQKEGNNVDHNKGKKSVQQDKTSVNKGQTAGPEEEK